MTILTTAELAKVYDQLPEASSFGKPRDAFTAAKPFPFMHTGEGKYEVVHTSIPTGTPMAFGGLDSSQVQTQVELLAKLQAADIYPFGHSGDFSGQDAGKLQASFQQKSVVNNDQNPQAALDLLKGLTPQGLGKIKYDALVVDLADNMRLFKDKDGKPVGTADERKGWVQTVLDGLSTSTRYTRLDNPVRVVTFTEDTTIKAPTGADWSATTDKVVVIEKTTDKTTGTTNFSVRTVEAATFDRTYQIGDGSKKAGDLTRVNPTSLIEAIDTGARQRATPSAGSAPTNSKA